jgi:hypothetical protein
LVAGTLLGLGQRRPQAVVEVDPACLDFGTQWVQQAFPWKVRIRNVTHDQVRVEKVATSCGCAQVRETSIILPPGGTGEVELRLDLTDRLAESPVRDWAFDTQVVPVVSLMAKDGRKVSQPVWWYGAAATAANRSATN